MHKLELSTSEILCLISANTNFGEAMIYGGENTPKEYATQAGIEAKLLEALKS